MSASSSRRLPLYARKDLEVQRQVYQGRDYWILKDPLTLKYYRFEEEEFALLQMLDGSHSPDQIKLKFDFEFAPQKITLQELNQFIGMLYRSSLLISDLPNQGEELLKRANKNRGTQLRQTLSSLMSIRFKGFDPDRLLGWLNGWIGWVFAWPIVFLSILLALSAGGLIFTQYDQFAAKLPNFQDFFAAKNWIWLALVLAITKVMHEFGHGLACKRFGAQCHEMGFMLLVMTPCLYVNVSDSWLLPNKWKRIAIAAAGMYAELILASMATFVWWFSNPGIINQLALNLIFVCSVSTLLINANPLLRYDGYYILSDLLEIPNLRSKATAILNRISGQVLLGIETRHDPFLPVRHRWLFAAYSVAAAIYRWVVTLSIFWFIYKVLEPYGFKIIGQILAMAVLYGLLISPFWKLYKYFSTPGRMNAVKPIRFAVSASVLGLMIFAILLIPVPHHVHCSLYVQGRDAARIYVEQDGVLEKIFVRPNTMVKSGDPILELESYKLKVQLASMQTDLERARQAEENAVEASNLDKKASFQREHLRTAVVSTKASLARRERDIEQLTVRAPQSGLFLSPPGIEEKKSDSGELRNWIATPLDQRNIGAYLEKQTFVGQIVPDPKKLEAILAIDQADIEFVHLDQNSELVITQMPGKSFSGKVSAISSSKMKEVPRSLSSQHGGDIVVTRDETGAEVPQSTTFMVTVPFESKEQLILPGSTGVAKIRTGSQTIGQRIWRLLNRTFKFDLS